MAGASDQVAGTAIYTLDVPWGKLGEYISMNV
jgi:hypothetical protein